MTWRQIQLNNWTDFVQLVEHLNLNEQGDAGWYFRGQANKRWSLLPSLVREVGGITVKRALGIEFGATQRFISQYHLYAPIDGVNRSQWSQMGWWMLMQHYSCPTRLLDWTLSPYVALYFAVEQLPEYDGAVWFFPSSALETIMANRYGTLRFGTEKLFETDTVEAVYPIEDVQHSRRSAPQQAVFTVCTHVKADHGDVISEAFASNEDKTPINKIIVPATLKKELLSKLGVMNITPNALFPGLDGLGRAAHDYVRLRAWRTHNEGNVS